MTRRSQEGTKIGRSAAPPAAPPNPNPSPPSAVLSFCGGARQLPPSGECGPSSGWCPASAAPLGFPQQPAGTPSACRLGLSVTGQEREKICRNCHERRREKKRLAGPVQGVYCPCRLRPGRTCTEVHPGRAYPDTAPNSAGGFAMCGIRPDSRLDTVSTAPHSTAGPDLRPATSDPAACPTPANKPTPTANGQFAATPPRRPQPAARAACQTSHAAAASQPVPLRHTPPESNPAVSLGRGGRTGRRSWLCDAVALCELQP
jgi:hypothetical protein